MMFVGRPGLGKTAPLSFAYRPLRMKDTAWLMQYKQEWEALQDQDGNSGEGAAKRPSLNRLLVSDITPEAVMRILNDNLRGICIYVDEILGMFNSLNQYSHGQFVEQLLTAFSGEPLSVIRCNNPVPLHILYPCISLVGTIQTSLVSQLFKRGFKNNGFLDRVIFVYPENQKITPWDDEETPTDEEQSKSLQAEKEWEHILTRIVDLPCSVGEDGAPHYLLLGFNEEARQRFYAWHNALVETVNAIEDEALIDSRTAKYPLIAARLALCLQALKWACGEGEMAHVDADSVEQAIRLMDYFEKGYRRLSEYLRTDEDIPKAFSTPMRLYDCLPQRFTTAEAVKIAGGLGSRERTAKECLKKLQDCGWLEKVEHGVYQKSSATESVQTK
jgi:hypothetical protein